MAVCEIAIETELPRASDDSNPPRHSPDRIQAASSDTSRAARRRLIFPALWLFIGLVSAFDTYLLVKFQDHLPNLEQNPMASALLSVSGGEPSLLVGIKFMTSIIVLGILMTLHLQNRRVGLIVTGGLAGFQLGLLGYLILA